MTATIVIKPGKYESLPDELKGRVLTVKHDKEAELAYPTFGRQYKVFLDTELIGSVRGAKEDQYVTVGRIRHRTGMRMQWRGYSGGRGIGYPRDSRAAAAMAVAQKWLHDG